MKIMHLIVGMFFVLLSINARADIVGITQAEFYPHYVTQKTPLWCWAASAQMVLSWQGLKLKQEEIILRATGKLGGAGSFVDIINTVNGKFNVPPNNLLVSGQYVQGAPFPTVLYNQLRQKKPVILTYQSPGGGIGHAIVVTAIDATITTDSVLVNKLYVFDPFAYDVMPGPGYGASTLVYNPMQINKVYDLNVGPGGIWINPGLITGVLLVDATKL